MTRRFFCVPLSSVSHFKSSPYTLSSLLHSHLDYPQWTISLSYLQEKREVIRQGFPTLPASIYSLSWLFSATPLWWHQKWCFIRSPVLMHLLAYLSHTLWSLLESCSVSHSLSPILPHQLLFTTSHSALRQYQEPQYSWEFPGSPVVRTQHFHCRGPGSIPSQGTKILQAVQCGQRKKKELQASWAPQALS